MFTPAKLTYGGLPHAGCSNRQGAALVLESRFISFVYGRAGWYVAEGVWNISTICIWKELSKISHCAQLLVRDGAFPNHLYEN